MTRAIVSPVRRLAAAALAAALAAAPAAAQFPAAPPAPGPVRPAAFPPFQEATFANGMRVVLVENHRDPVVAFRLSVAAGAADVPQGKEGLAQIFAQLLTRGAGARSAEQVASAIEGAGGSLVAVSGPDFLTLYGSVLSPNTALAMQLAGDAVVRPAFADREVELARQQELSGLQFQQAQPAAIASRTFTAALYGSHPYGRTPTPASVRGITRADLVAYQQARLRPQGALLVVAGDATMAQLRTLATQSFGAWTGAPGAAPTEPDPPRRTAREIVLVNRPGSVQSNILAGNLTAGPADPARYAATVANKLLGGGADARLFAILRERKGWTYGAYSNLTRPRGVGAFTASAETRTEVTDSALVELLAQLKRIATEPVSAADLANATNAIVGSFPLSVETAPQIAEQVATVKLLGLPPDYLQTFRPRIAAVTPAALEAAAGRYIRPDEALVVVVGDGAKLYDRLATIGPVRVVDAQGNAVAAASLTAPAAPAAPLPLDLARLAARRDSFVVRVQGNPLGYTVNALERAGDGWVYRSETLLAGGVVRQSGALTTDARLAPRRFTLTGTQQGQPVNTSLTYANGRVTGTASRPTPQGAVTSAPVDVAVPAGVLDESVTGALLPLLPLKTGSTQPVTVFSSTRGAVTPLTLTVAGTETVAVPAGTFQTYRVDQTGGDQPVRYFVTTAAPYRLVRVLLAGGQLDLQLAK